MSILGACECSRGLFPALSTSLLNISAASALSFTGSEPWLGFQKSQVEVGWDGRRGAGLAWYLFWVHLFAESSLCCFCYYYYYFFCLFIIQIAPPLGWILWVSRNCHPPPIVPGWVLGCFQLLKTIAGPIISSEPCLAWHTKPSFQSGGLVWQGFLLGSEVWTAVMSRTSSPPGRPRHPGRRKKTAGSGSATS